MQGLQNRLGTSEVQSKLPPIIEKHELVPLAHKVTDVSRLKKATRILNIHDAKDRTKLSGLADGTYVYVMDTNGHLAISNRVMDPGAAAMRNPDGTFLGSHAGLAALLESEFKAPPQFVAAGEVVVRSGQVKVVSNGSGTYRGAQSNLTYAAEHMQSMGLAVDVKTELRDYSANKYANPHGSVESQVRDALKLEHDPHLKQIWEYTRKVMGELDRNLTDSKPIRKVIMDPSTSPADQALLFKGVQFFSNWRQPQEEEGYVVHHYLESMGEEQFLRLLNKFSEIASANPAHP
ncbi:MAG: hypothetical protein ACJ763_19515 [Bdellovibrionia bacterium]